MTTMNNEPGVREQAPERIYMHPTSAEANVNPWPLEPGEYVEYIRADLAATRMRERCVTRVREMRDEWKAEESSDLKYAVWGAGDIITALESLTLDGEK